MVGVIDGEIHIGPRSVGAAPGPACFARGGTDATVSDALLIVGVLDADRYLGGDLKLDVARAERALATHVGEPLGISASAAAVAVLSSFQEQAGAAVREMVSSAGRDPAEATLLAFGGAGPVLACGIARAAGIARVIVPHLSAVFSAFGIGFSGLAHEYSVPLTDEPDSARDAMLTRARRDMFGEGVAPEECSFETRIRSIVDGDIRDAVWSNGSPPAGDHLVVRASHPLPTFELVPDEPRAAQPAAPSGKRCITFGETGEGDVPVYDGDKLTPAEEAEGPALVAGDYFTALIEPGWRFRVSSNFDLILEAQR